MPRNKIYREVRVPAVMHTALDGRKARVAVNALDLGRPVSSIGMFIVGRRSRQEITAGSRSLSDKLAELSGVTLTEEYSFQGGTLRVGAAVGPAGLVRVASWVGKTSSVTANLYRSSSSADAIALFSKFTVSETSSGEATVVAAAPEETPLEDAPMIAKEIADLGLLEIEQLTPTVARKLPTWPGTPVAGGELFVADKDTPRMRFVLVNETAVTTILPKQALIGDSRTLSELAELVVEWV